TVDGTLDLNGFDNTISSLAGTSSGIVEDSSATAATLTVGDSTSTTFAGNIEDDNGSLSLTKNGSGTLTLSGDDTYSGATLVSAGTLQAGSTTAFAAGSAFTVDGTLDLNGFDNTISSLAGTSSGIVEDSSATAATLTVGDSTSTTFAGNIEDDNGSLSLTKNGSGTLTLSGDDTYSGATWVSDGTLQASSTTGF